MGWAGRGLGKWGVRQVRQGGCGRPPPSPRTPRCRPPAPLASESIALLGHCPTASGTRQATSMSWPLRTRRLPSRAPPAAAACRERSGRPLLQAALLAATRLLRSDAQDAQQQYSPLTTTPPNTQTHSSLITTSARLVRFPPGSNRTMHAHHQNIPSPPSLPLHPRPPSTSCIKDRTVSYTRTCMHTQHQVMNHFASAGRDEPCCTRRRHAGPVTLYRAPLL